MLQTLPNALGEVLQPRDHGAQDRVLREPVLGFFDGLLCLSDLLAQALGAWLQLLQADRACLVGIQQPFEAALVVGDPALGLSALELRIGRSAVGGAAAQPLLLDSFGILQDLPYRIPDLRVEHVGADRAVVASTGGSVARRLRAGAAVVAIDDGAGRLRGRPAAEGVPTARADNEPLQQVALPSRVPLRQLSVAHHLLARGGKDLGRHDRRHRDRDPLVGRSSPMGPCIAARYPGLAPSRSEWPRLNRLALAVGGLPHVGRVAQQLVHP
ncbi:hypothetical protein WMF40_05930 [Sorangium sp. So ce854]